VIEGRTTPWAQLGLATVVLALSSRASAGSNDAEVEEVVGNVLGDDFANGRYVEALQKLGLAREACAAKSACSGRVRARVEVAIGTVLAGGMRQRRQAIAAFTDALRDDPAASLFSGAITPEVEQAWREARLARSGGGTRERDADAKPLKECPDSGRASRGWRSIRAECYFREASAAEAVREWIECARYARASLDAEDRVTTRWLAATCQERAGLWIEALSDYETIADPAAAPRSGPFPLAERARARARALRDKIPKIVVRRPANASDLVVKMNGVDVPADQLDGEISVNPGQRTISARAKVGNTTEEFEEVVDMAEFETATVELQLGKDKKNPHWIRCVLESKTQDDFRRCMAEPGRSFNLRIAAELTGYHDDDAVDVVSPAITVAAESPVGGWGVGAFLYVDVVTAASADIVATASPRWTEVRYVPGISGHRKLGDVDVNARGSMSFEPDYVATAVGAGASVDLLAKRVTPTLTYTFGYDISGRAGTPFADFSRRIIRHGIDGAVIVVTDKATFVGLSFTAVLESGDTSKPYRFVPMFSAEKAPQVPAGFAASAVNREREPERVLEQLPTDRRRWAIAGRLAHRFASSTLRIEERLYTDSWGVTATTTDARYLIDFGASVRAWPHLRFNAQTGADFWRRAYVSKRTSGGLEVPALRTGDRELGPLISWTLGAGARVGLGSDEPWGLTVTGDVSRTKFLDHLFVVDRLGIFGGATLDVELK